MSSSFRYRIYERKEGVITCIRKNLTMNQARAILATYEKTWEKGQNIVWVSGPALIFPVGYTE